MVFVLRHGSRSIEGVYLKSPEIKRETINSCDALLNIEPVHMFSSYETNLPVASDTDQCRV